MTIPYSRQTISKIDIFQVQKSLRQNFLTQGPLVRKFEKNISKFVNSKYTVSANSASSALEIACKSIGLKKNDYAWTVPITYVATANAILHCQAKLDLVDIDYSTFNISIEKLEKKLLISKKKNKLPKLIIPVHLGGEPCDMESIYKLSKKYKFKIIEDASHAFGSKIKNSKIGSCKFSDMTVFSFHPVKIFTTGEGGCITTNSKKYFENCQMLRSGGITKNQRLFTYKKKPKWYYEQKFLGHNYRMSDINASLGISQLKKVKNYNILREKIKRRYISLLKDLPINHQVFNKLNKSSNHLFIISLKNHNRDKLYKFLKKSKIETNLHYIPIYKHPFYKKYFNKIKKQDFKNSENYYKNCLSIPIFPLMKPFEQNKVFNKIKDFLTH